MKYPTLFDQPFPITSTDIKDTLPKVPSELLKLGLNDLELCEKDDRYIVSMQYAWHFPDRETGKCVVCFAGVVIAKSLKSDPNRRYIARRFSEDIHSKLLALDYFHVGMIKQGIVRLRGHTDKIPSSLLKEFRITPYDENKEAFKEELHEIANLLTEAGF